MPLYYLVKKQIAMETVNFNIESACRITNQFVRVNDNMIVANDNDKNQLWFNPIYRFIGSSYPKFFKMDHLCKAGFLASEFLMKEAGLDPDEVKNPGFH